MTQASQNGQTTQQEGIPGKHLIHNGLSLDGTCLNCHLFLVPSGQGDPRTISCASEAFTALCPRHVTQINSVYHSNKPRNDFYRFANEEQKG